MAVGRVMSMDRPNPDELLKRVRASEAETRRGKLKIFFGYAAGVGKTFAMLEAAHRERAQGIDVVVGYVEPHDRPETEALLHGLEVLPPRLIPYRGVHLRELDLDAALTRRPRLILVDELAHTNAEGLRHAKRWQDVEELLDAGIDVYTTLNVQHLESLNDVIAKITGVAVKETLPDNVFERANDIELVDLTPEDLIERLKAGKVYIPYQAERALQSFFQKANLIALRELSLREAAHRLRMDVEAARQEKAIKSPWATAERLLVCVGPSPTSTKLIRTAKRMAAAFGGEWLAVAVETRGRERLNDRGQIARHLALAEQLGAETHTLVGDKVANTLLDLARTRNVTKIIVGKTAIPWWKRLFRRTVVDALLEKSGDIDVYVIRGEGHSEPAREIAGPTAAIPWTNYLATAGVITICGLLGWVSFSRRLGEANIVMIFLLGVAFVAARYGRGPAIACAIVSVLVFDFFFVPPYFSFAVDDVKYALTFGVMLSIGLLISTLTARIRDQLGSSQLQERRTAALYRLTKQLSQVAGSEFLVGTAGAQLTEIFDGQVVIFLGEPGNPLALRFGDNNPIAKELGGPVNAIVAQWVAEHDQVAGIGTDTLPNATALFVPLIGSQRTVGALGVRPVDPQRFLDPEQRRLLETCASLIALSIERDESVLAAQQAQMQVQTEKLRNSLLSSVSHDLRTPLAAIAGAASALLESTPSQNSKSQIPNSDSSGGGDSNFGIRHSELLPESSPNLNAPAQQELLLTVVEESRRLARQVDNLLDMTRLESGTVELHKEWHVLEEIIGTALARLRHELEKHEVRVDIEQDFPLLALDGTLIEQVFFNLLENAGRHTPAGTKIEIRASVEIDHAVISFADNGPGLPPGTESQVFEKFFRGIASPADGRRGVGLGLAICQGIIRAHGGTIRARNRPGGGTEFVISLPCDPRAPKVNLVSGDVQTPLQSPFTPENA
jgi:two-component system sensor histidine kinase KdpD